MSEVYIKSIHLDTRCKIRCSVTIVGREDEIVTDISENVADYLDPKRADAFVVSFVYFAMTNGCDIRSDVPVSEELLYNLENHFIDALAHDGSGLYRTRLYLPTIPSADKVGNIVATGVSCGVDCFHTLYLHQKIQMQSFRISHLAFYNVGSHQTGKGKLYDNSLYKGRYELCKAFAEEYGYSFYYINSNIHDVIERHGGYAHISNHSYMASFCILLLQKGILKYYYSAGYPYTDFRVYKSHKTEVLDSAMYDLLTFYCISYGGLKVYSSGGNMKRIDKTRQICKYKPAQKYLNVCVNNSHNDGKCFKCVRTLLSLDAVGDINDFNEVFDVDDYKRNKLRYIRKIWFDSTFMHDELAQEIMPFYEKKISLNMKIRAFVENWKYFVIKHLS